MSDYSPAELALREGLLTFPGYHRPMVESWDTAVLAWWAVRQLPDRPWNYEDGDVVRFTMGKAFLETSWQRGEHLPGPEHVRLLLEHANHKVREFGMVAASFLPTPTLEALLEGVTPENLHHEQLADGARGDEAL